MVEGVNGAYSGEATSIIGFSHKDRNLDKVDKYLTTTFSGGIRKLMLELPSWADRPHRVNGPESENGIFENLARRQLSRCQEIIYGDVGERNPLLPPKWIGDLIRRLPSRWRGKATIFTYDVMQEIDINMDVLASMFGNRARDIAMAKVLENERPDLVLLGNAHAAFLKKQFPQAQYTRLVCSLDEKIGYGIEDLLYPGSRPDQTIIL